MREEAFEKHRIPCAALAYAPCFSNDGAYRVTNPSGLLLSPLPHPPENRFGKNHKATGRRFSPSLDIYFVDDMQINSAKQREQKMEEMNNVSKK